MLFMSSCRVAILGCGAIGNIIANSIDSGRAGKTRLEAVFDNDRSRCEELAEGLKIQPKIAGETRDILEDDEIDLVVEAASQQAVAEYALDILKSGKDLLVLSIGAFSDEDLFKSVQEKAEEKGCKVYLPSGAILGLDGVQAAGIASLDEASITTRKPPETLSKAKFVREEEIGLSDLEEPKVVFEGAASEAVKAFPKSLNVAASLSIAGAGFEKTKVKIIADPSLGQNVHEIEVRGEAGELKTTAHNFPSPENPKTSYLAALSAIRTLRNITESIQIGA